MINLECRMDYEANGNYKFVAFDLEYSGIQRDLAPGVEKVEGRKQTIDERYQNVKVLV